MSNRISTHPSHVSHRPPRVIRKVMIRETVDFITLDGLYLEFGVWNGESINYIAQVLPTKIIYGFDCWTGIPEDWNFNDKSFPKGSWSAGGRPPKPKPNVRFISGLFETTLPMFVAEHPNIPTAFVHIDSDLYASAKTIFKHMGSSFVPGTVILFDEYASNSGEKQAFDEWLEESNLYAVMIRETPIEQVSFVITASPDQVLLPVTPTWSIDVPALIQVKI